MSPRLARSPPALLGVLAGLVLAALTLVAVSAPAAARAAGLPAGTPFNPASPEVLVVQGAPTQLNAGVEHNGSLTFNTIGSATYSYNAAAFDNTDDYLYGVARATTSPVTNGDVVRIDSTGAVVDTGVATGFNATANAGALDPGNGLMYFGSAPSGTTLVQYNPASNALAASSPLTLSSPLLAYDLTYDQGYLWGLAYNNGPVIQRIDPGTGTVTNFTVATSLVPGLTSTSNVAGAAWTYGNGNLGFQINATGTVYQISVASPSASTPTFTQVSSQAGPANNQNDGANVAGGTTNFSITSSAPTPAIPGGSITYTYTITNNGPGSSSGYALSDTLPSSLSNPSTSSTGCTVAAGVFSCEGNPMASGASTTVSVTGTAPTPNTSPISNTATVLPNEYQSNASGDSSTSTVQPAAPALTITNTASSNTATPGGTLSYTLTPSTSAAAGDESQPVTVTAALSNGVTVSSSPTGTGWNCSATTVNSSTVSCTYTPSSTITPGTALPAITVPTAIAPGDRGTATATATVSSPDNANSATASTSTDSVNLVPSVDDAVTVTAPSSATEGSPAAFTVKATDNGPSTATNVAVTVPVPSGASFTSGSSSSACSLTNSTTVTCTQASLTPNASQTFTVAFTTSTPGALSVTASVTQSEADSNSNNNTSAAASVNVPRRDDLGVTASGTSTAVPGGAITENFVVTDNGPDAATGFTLSAPLPSGVSNAATSTTGCSIASNTLNCTEGALPSGTTQTITVTMNAPATFQTAIATTATVATTGTDTDPTSSNNSVTFTTNPAGPLLSVAGTSSPTPGVPGGALTYTLTGTVSTNGPGESRPITITQTLGNGVTVSATPTGTGWNCSATTVGSAAVSCTDTPGSTVAPGTSLPAITVPTSVASGARGTTTATATVSSSDNANSGSASSTSLQTTLNPSVNDSVTVTPPSAPGVNTPITYTVNAANAGPSTATGVVVTVPIPSGATYVSGPSSCTATSSTVTCTVATLAPNGSQTLPLKFQTATAGPLNVTASVTQTETDSNTSNNSASGSATVTRNADLVLSETGGSSATPGGQISESFTVTNNGPAASSGFTFSAGLPTGVSNPATPTSGCTVSSTTLTCTEGALANGTTSTITLTMNAPSVFHTAVSGTATVTGVDTDPSSSNNTVTVTTNPAGPLLSVATTSNASAVSGSGLTYTLTGTVGASGPGESRPVTITQTLGIGVTVSATPTGTGWNCTATTVGSSTVSCTDTPSPSITYGTSLPAITVPTTIAPGARGTTTATATVSSSDNASTSSASTASDQVTLNPSVSDSVSVSAPTSATVGSPVTITVTAANAGPSTATGTTVTVAIPAGATYDSGPAGCAVNAAATAVVCSVGTLAPGATAALPLRFTPTSAGTLEISASITQTETNSASGGGAGSATITVSPAPPAPPTAPTASAGADLLVTVTPPSTPLAVRRPATFTVRAVNRGTAADPDVVVSIPVPRGVTVQSVSSGCSVSGSVIQCSAGNLAAGADRSFSIVVVPDASGTVSVTASAKGTLPNSDPANATATGSLVSAGSGRWLSVKLTTRKRARFGFRSRLVATVRDSSTIRATKVTASITLPRRTVLRHTVKGCRTNRKKTVLSCKIGTLSAHQSKRIVILVRFRHRGLARPRALARGIRAGVRASARTRTKVLVYVQPHLVLRVFFPGSRLPAGRDERIKFSIRDSNHTTASRVRLCNTVPKGATIVSARGLKIHGAQVCVTVARVGKVSVRYSVIVRMAPVSGTRRVWDRASATGPGLRKVTVARHTLLVG